MNYDIRQTAARRKMEAEGADALLISHLPNVRYLTGFSGSNALLLLRPERAILFTDGRYREQAGQEVRGAEVVIPPRGDLWKAAAGRLRRVQQTAVEFDQITVAQRERFERHWTGKLANAAGWIAGLRRIKDGDEIAALRRAVQLASSVFLPTVQQWKPGMSETEAAGRLEFALRRRGGEGLAFETIAVGGARGALVHGRPGAHPLPERGFVVVDYGVQLGGYMSDMTRTPYFAPAGGRPDARARKVYATVLEAQAQAIAAIRAGVRAGAVDQVARQVIEKAGLGEYFPHSLGHGVGLEIHEAPRLAARSQDVLAAGEVVTVEPGVYIPGWGGVRIEDMVQVTNDGAEVLTPTEKDLLVL